MKEIQLTRGKVAIVDDDDYVKLSRHKWYATRECGKYWYAVRGLKGKKRLKMHREIMEPKPGLFIDHIKR